MSLADSNAPARPVPAPRSRVNIVSSTDNSLTYENVALTPKIKNHAIQEKRALVEPNMVPTPAPRPPVTRTKSCDEVKPKNKIYPNLDSVIDEPVMAKSTGAIRKAPAVPGKLNNDLKKPPTSNFYVEDNSFDDDVKSIGSVSTTSTTSSADSPGKFKTSSPGELLGLLGKSISERVVTGRKEAAHKLDKNYKNTKRVLREKITDYTPHIHFSLGRRKDDKKMAVLDFEDDRPKTAPVNDAIFNNISFNSPLKAKINNFPDLTKEAESTYEIPRSPKLVPKLPNYDEAVSDSPASCSYSASQSSINSAPSEMFHRNGHLTQSLYTNAKSGKVDSSAKLSLGKLNRSENDLRTKSKLTILSPNVGLHKRRPVSLSSSSSEESLPCPKFPPPIFAAQPEEDSIYGKIKATEPTRPPRNMANAEMAVEYRNKPNYENTMIRDKLADSMRVNVDSAGSTRIFSRMAVPEEDEYVTLTEKRPIRQPIEGAATASNSWAFYDPSPNAKMLTDLDESPPASSPEPIYVNNAHDSAYGALCDMQSSLLRPVKPGTSGGEGMNNSTPNDILYEFDPLIEKRGLTLPMDMKNLNLVFLEEFLSEDTYGTTSNAILPEEVEDSDSDNNASGEEAAASSTVEQLRPKTEEPKAPVAQTKSLIVHQNLRLPGSMENILEEDDTADLPGTSKTTWFANNADKLEKKTVIDPVNNLATTSVEKVAKSTLKLPHKTTVQPKDDYLPSYDESMAEPPKANIPQSPVTTHRQETSAMKNIWTRIKRTPSLKSSRPEVKTIIEMVPKPPLTDRLLSHHGPLLKLPTGVMEDLLKELSTRTAMLREKVFYTFQDTARLLLKEQIQLAHVTSIQAVVHQKFVNEADIHCFEIGYALPKATTSSVSQAMSTNPNLLMTTAGDSGNVKTTRGNYIYAVYKVSERNLWMQKLFESMSAAFPPAQTAEFTRAGWCYMKKSITSAWTSAWILLSKRKLLLHASGDTKLEVLDLRKMRCIGMTESDESIKHLHVEKGALMLIDCPPYTMYCIMSTPRDTKTWKSLIKESALANGVTLKNQQLTKDNVPVLVDKCVNFVYTHGSMSEGIYRKSGSATQVQKLLTQFKQDAFSVQLIRTEFNEHDVSSALKKFMRELPDPLIGRLSDSFIAVSELKSKVEKIQLYKELLARLPTVEYQTLRKLIGHLNFINSQRAHNKMGVENLAMIWGAALLRDNLSDSTKFSQKETNVVAELITLYKNLYQPQADEIQKEQIMLSVLKKYHAAAENLSDSVKMSGDLKVWIKLDPNPGNAEEDKEQANVSLTPTKSVNDVCKELSAKMRLPAYQLTMEEVILNDELTRPMHHAEKVLDAVLRWTYWADADRKNNYLVVKPTKFLFQIERAIKTLPSLTPNMEMKYADQKTKALKPYIIELVDGKVTVFKREKHHAVKFKELEVGRMRAFLGSEKKRESQLRWGITLIEDEFKKRSRDAPFIGHLLAGSNINDQIIWYASIMHSLHKADIIAQPEIIIA